MRRRSAIPAVLFVAAGAVLTLPLSPAMAQTPSVQQRVDPGQQAASAADQLVTAGASDAALRKSPSDVLIRQGVVTGTRGTQYVSYERTYRGLPVVGGDVVVTTDAAGAVRGTSVAQKSTITVGTTAKVASATAAATARAQLATVTEATAPRLVVLAWTETPVLAWETVVTGAKADATPSHLRVYVDATTGAVADLVDDVREGSGTGYYNGSVSITTSGSGTSYSMTDTTRSGLKCGGQGGTAYTGTDDAWGTGGGTNLETACVDAMYAAQAEWNMLKAWFGRTGVTSSGGAVPIRVGLADVNAYWNGSYVNFGHSQDNLRQATPIDVVAHEIGHALFQYTPGGAGSGNENGGINEATGDIFGALTEAYANNANDPADYTVGEEVDLVGDGPIRYMYNPSVLGDPNCYTSSISSTEVHAAAGPLNHWFYLLAEGSAPSGKPASPTCNGSAVTGIGIQLAGEIYYNAMLAKTSTWKHANIRTATLTAAKNLFPSTCTEFNAVKAAWDAISVPAQSGEATCGTTPPPTTSCSASNAADVSIPDAGAAVTSTITISGCGRAASATATAEVHIVHTYRGDLVINLVAPDGTSYRLKSSGSDSAANVDATYSVNLSSEAADGAWKLQVQDVYSVDSGYLNTWTLTL